MTADDRPAAAADVLEHLQRAVLEMIEAARSTLDLVEGVVADPQSLSALVAQFGHLAQTVVAAASTSGPSASGATGDGGNDGAGAGSRPTVVQHIPVT